jgi:hypothetical protein
MIRTARHLAIAAAALAAIATGTAAGPQAAQAAVTGTTAAGTSSGFAAQHGCRIVITRTPSGGTRRVYRCD